MHAPPVQIDSRHIATPCISIEALRLLPWSSAAAARLEPDAARAAGAAPQTQRHGARGRGRKGWIGGPRDGGGGAFSEEDAGPIESQR